MNEAIDLSMSFDDDDDYDGQQQQLSFSQHSSSERSSSPHNTKDTAIVIDSSDDDEDEDGGNAKGGNSKKPASQTTSSSSYNPANDGPPKRPQSAFFLYVASNRDKGLDVQTLSNQFNALSREELDHWNKMEVEDKERYRREMALYDAYQLSGSGRKMSPSKTAAARGSSGASSRFGGGSSASKNGGFASIATAARGGTSSSWGVKSESTSTAAAAYAASRKVSMSPTPNNNNTTTAVSNINSNKPFGCTHCSERFYTHRQKNRHQKKCKKKHVRVKGERGGGKVKGEKKPQLTVTEGKEKDEAGEEGEEAEEITYTSYRPMKLKFGKDHPGEFIIIEILICVVMMSLLHACIPTFDHSVSHVSLSFSNSFFFTLAYIDPVVENSTLSAVAPPDVTYNLAMPASILSEGKLSNLQLEAIVYGCQRHMVDLPVKPVEEMELNEMHMMGEEGMPSVDKPLRAGEYVFV